MYNFLITIFYLYIIISAIYLLLDNRNPSSTFAWLFIFIIFPLGGIACYILFGKNHRILGNKRKKMEVDIKNNFRDILNELTDQHKDAKLKINRTDPFRYKSKLVNLLERSSLSYLTENNNVQIIQDGKQKFSMLFEDLKKAKSTIHMAYFIWRDDELTQELKEILINKAKEGVEIRILVDAIGSFTLPNKYRNDLRKAGIHFYRYLNVDSIFKLHTINYRNHRKIVIIDGIIGYTGGMNMGQEYISGAFGKNYWRDTHMRIVGDAVKYLQAIFVMEWMSTTNDKIFGAKYFPEIDKKSGNTEMQIAVSGPDGEWESTKQIYFELICAAKKNVYIQTPYFVPDKPLTDALMNAALSDVDVKIMITGVPDKKIPYWAAYTYFESLLESGVKIYHYNKCFLHSKTIVIDSEVSSIGTANFDIRSFSINYELMTVLYDNKLSAQMEEDFITDLSECEELTTNYMLNQPTSIKLRNSLARLLSPIL